MKILDSLSTSPEIEVLRKLYSGDFGVSLDLEEGYFVIEKGVFSQNLLVELSYKTRSTMGSPKPLDYVFSEGNLTPLNLIPLNNWSPLPSFIIKGFFLTFEAEEWNELFGRLHPEEVHRGEVWGLNPKTDRIFFGQGCGKKFEVLRQIFTEGLTATAKEKAWEEISSKLV